MRLYLNKLALYVPNDDEGLNVPDTESWLFFHGATGMTEYEATGVWRNQAGKTIREDILVVEAFFDLSEDTAMLGKYWAQQVIDKYKQDSMFYVTERGAYEFTKEDV